MHAVPSRTFLVRPATAASSEIDSSRGLPSMLSPTHTASKKPERSASSASCSMVSTVVAPNRIPRLGRVSPIRMKSPLRSGGGNWHRGQEVEDGTPSLIAFLDVKEVPRAFDHVQLRVRDS